VALHAPAARAANPTDKHDAESRDIIFDTNVEAGAEVRTGDISRAIPGRVLVSIETIVHDGRRKLDYAWISAKVGIATDPSGAGTILPSLDVTIVPVVIHDEQLEGGCTDDATGEKMKCPVTLDIRVAPIDFQREVSFGEQGAVVIHALGLQGTLSDREGKKLIQAYVDFAGVRYMNMGANPSLFGMDLFDFGIQGKLSWTFAGDKGAINFYPFILRGQLGFGRSGGDLFNAIDFTGQLLSRLEIAFKTAFGQYGAFLEAGGQALTITRTGDLPNDVHVAALARLGFQVKF
jgi:hypothetical protein